MRTRDLYIEYLEEALYRQRNMTDNVLLMFLVYLSLTTMMLAVRSYINGHITAFVLDVVAVVINIVNIIVTMRRIFQRKKDREEIKALMCEVENHEEQGS